MRDHNFFTSDDKREIREKMAMRHPLLPKEIKDMRYDDGHWSLKPCPVKEGYVHIYCAHSKDPFPECWSADAAMALALAIQRAFMGFRGGP